MTRWRPSACPSSACSARDDRFAWRDRHLGLIPVAERGAEVARLARRPGRADPDRCDLAAIAQLGRRGATAGTRASLPMPEPVPGPPVRIAVAAGPAFSFTYPDNLEALAAAGAELVPFDPCRDPPCPTASPGWSPAAASPRSSPRR